MRTTKENGNCSPPLLYLQKFLLFLICHFSTDTWQVAKDLLNEIILDENFDGRKKHFPLLSQCETGLESACIWIHDEKTALLWRTKREGQESYVELSNCIVPNCGIGIIHSPWLPSRETEVYATIQYKIFGTSSVYLRLNMNLDDTTTPHQIYSKVGNYAYGYPKTWTSHTVKIPATHTRYRLVLKAFVPYREAMVAVRGITLDGTVYLTSTSTSSSSTTTSSSVPQTTASTSTRRTTSTTTTTTSTTTTTTTDKPVAEQKEIFPTHYGAEIEAVDASISETAETSENRDRDYFLEKEDDDVDEDESEDERRFQALEVEDFIGEEDLIQGYTTVVEPQLCMYK